MTALNDSPLNALSEHVHALNTTFDQLFKTIDEQIDAIIMQDVVHRIAYREARCLTRLVSLQGKGVC